MGFIDIRVGGKSLVLSNAKMQLVLRGFSLDNEIVLGSYTVPVEAPVCFENEQIFGNQHLLENAKSNPVINDADLYIGGVLQARGYILLLKANSFGYRFSFIYKPISNVFFTRQLREIEWDNTKFWRGEPVPVNYTEYMDFLDDVVQEVDAYIPGGEDTFCLFPVKCPNWTELPEEVIQTVGFEDDNTKRRLNLFSGVGNALARNTVEVTQEENGGTANHDILYMYTADALNDQKICPFIYTAFILEEIWRLDGWKVAGSLFTHEDFLRDVLINSYAIDRYAACGAVFFKWDDTAFTVGSKLPIISDYQFSDWYNNTTKELEFPSSLVITTSGWVHLMARLYIELYFVADVTGRTITIEFYEESPTPGTMNYFGSGVGDGNKVIISLLSRNGSTSSALDVNPYRYSMRIVSTDIPAPDQVLSSIYGVLFLTDEDGGYYYSNVLDTNVEYKNHLPDISVGEFVKSVIKRFGATQEYDFANKTVYYNIIKDTIAKPIASDITDITISKSYEKDIKDFFIKGKYALDIEFGYDKSTHKIGVENPYTEQFLFDIPGCSLESYFQGTYKLPHFGTTGSSKQLGGYVYEGLIYIHYKGLQVGSDGLYPAPYASASNLISDGTEFSDYDMKLLYIIPFYWQVYLLAKSNPVTFKILMNIAKLYNLNLFELLLNNYQKYFPEEIIVNIGKNGIEDCELKTLQI